MNIRHQRKNVVARDSRKLRLETLEDRRMLATMVVTELGDGSLNNLAGDGQLSLREAVAAINTGAPVDGVGPASGQFGLNDAIVFNSDLFAGSAKTLSLTAGQLELQSSVILFGPSGNLLTIDAQQNSRVVDITATSGNFTIAQMTLTGGETNGLSQGGGAVRSMTGGRLLISNSTITASATLGSTSKGGGVSASGPLEIIDSSITNNRTVQTGGDGGGVFSTGNILLTGSTIAGNQTQGEFAIGGGVNSAGEVVILRSTVSGNQTFGSTGSAGGVLAGGDVELIESTISGNRTEGNFASGGGIIASGTITVTRSTIVNNQVLGASATGGGVQTTDTDIVVSGSIIANNTAGGGNADIQSGTGTLTVSHSLIGDATGLGIPTATNLLNQDPLLGPLAGGGHTKTHAPLAGSPVIDAGNEFIALPPTFDQRGVPFLRVADGDGNGSAVIDMGSLEVQATTTANADFDGDNDIDGSDFLAWQRGASKTSGVTLSDGDANGDGNVDLQDLTTWQFQFGGVAPQAAGLASAQQPLAAIADRANLIDLAIAVELNNAEATDADLASVLQPTFAAEGSAQQQAFSAISSSSQVAEIELLAGAKASQDLAADEGLVDELVSTSL